MSTMLRARLLVCLAHIRLKSNFSGAIILLDVKFPQLLESAYWLKAKNRTRFLVESNNFSYL